MSWYSVYGTGATIHGVARTDDGRVEFTAWLSFFFIPIVPLSSWSAIYIGGNEFERLTDQKRWFVDLRRVPHDGFRLAQTFVVKLFVALIAIAPTAIMIAQTEGRAATTAEMVVVFAGIVWPVALIVGSDRLRRNKLQGDSTVPATQAR